jgi:hypothetical protein
VTLRTRDGGLKESFTTSKLSPLTQAILTVTAHRSIFYLCFWYSSLFLTLFLQISALFFLLHLKSRVTQHTYVSTHYKLSTLIIVHALEFYGTWFIRLSVRSA